MTCPQPWVIVMMSYQHIALVDPRVPGQVGQESKSGAAALRACVDRRVWPQASTCGYTQRAMDRNESSAGRAGDRRGQEGERRPAGWQCG
jgi:hypothetical protein